MFDNFKKPRNDQLLYFVGFFTWGTVALMGVRFIEPGVVRTLCIGLLILYGVLFAFSSKIGSRKWERAYYIIQAAIIAALITLSPDWGVFPILYFMLSAAVMMSFSQREGLLWIGGFSLITTIIFVTTAGWQVGMITTLPYFAGYLFFGIFALAMAQARQERDKNERLLRELQEVHQQLQEYSARVEELAISKERNRLAREMHDTIGHRLTVAAVQLEGAQRLIHEKPQKSIKIVSTVREQVREALQELRGTVAAMREPLQVELPLQKALSHLLKSFETATDLQVHLAFENNVPPLTKAYRLTIYRIIQEALTNIQRHAQAQNVWVRVSLNKESLVTSIMDDGVGFPETIAEDAFGLAGVRERAAHFGGGVYLENRPNGGAQLRVELAAPKNAEISKA